MNGNIKHLSTYLDALQAEGNYFITKNQMLKELSINEPSLKNSISRLFKKHRLISLKHGLYLIVPFEYRNIGAPPPDWFIDQLMKAHEALYYVGLLSAAALNGAAHQQPQVFQVITNKVLRPIKIGRARIVFYLKKDLKNLPFLQIKTPTGYMAVSTPELTTFDLVSYIKQSGHIHHISTVLLELGEIIDPQKLFNIASHFPQSCIQRTGYILDELGFNKKTKLLLKLRSPRFYPLRPDQPYSFQQKDTKWNMYINEQLEPDE
jgi:predicted transcriptional regulator of viral defense system